MNNIYDQEEFFSKYSKMSRSMEGLNGAGEWHQLRALFPDFHRKAVLDLGCGFGWHSFYAFENGAQEVLAIDSSERMLREARRRNSAFSIEYRKCSIEEYEYPEKRWDIVISNLALHYIENIEAIFEKVFLTLKKDGIFIFNIEHPVFTSGVNQEWIYSENGEPIYWPVDKYFYPGKRTTSFLGSMVIKYHHTLTQILNGLLISGFTLERVEEARPEDKMLADPVMQNELRRPMMLLVKAKKQ